MPRLAFRKDRPIFLDMIFGVLRRLRLEVRNCPFCFRKRTLKHGLKLIGNLAIGDRVASKIDDLIADRRLSKDYLCGQGTDVGRYWGIDCARSSDFDRQDNLDDHSRAFQRVDIFRIVRGGLEGNS